MIELYFESKIKIKNSNVKCNYFLTSNSLYDIILL